LHFARPAFAALADEHVSAGVRRCPLDTAVERARVSIVAAQFDGDLPARGAKFLFLQKNTNLAPSSDGASALRKVAAFAALFPHKTDWHGWCCTVGADWSRRFTRASIANPRLAWGTIR
jgi:hypothetical protein